MLQKHPVALALLMAHSLSANADKKEHYEQTTIIGSKEDAAQLPGSAYVLSNEELEKFSYNDINSYLRAVPGVYLRQEEGYGLRPNIGIRGAVGERNNKITVMEDGILIAPAPYSGPAAYYFPSTGRINAIEVLKGPGTIAHGPFTVGGAINLISTPIPEDSSGRINLEMGENGERKAHFWAGTSNERGGILFESYQHGADGFQSIDGYADDTGFEKEDYLIKARWNTLDDGGLYHQFDVKFSYATENSDQSYLGLTNVDFAEDPDKRYGLTAMDNMDNKHQSASFSHLLRFNDDISLTTSVYHNTFERDWYKVNKIGDFSSSSIIEAANNGDQDAIDILHGRKDADVSIKHNARNYVSEGIQSNLNWVFDTGAFTHRLNTGIRLHRDEVDRYQPSDNYSWIDGELSYLDSSAPSASNNRLQQAEAVSLFFLDEIDVTKALTITTGLRYEKYRSQETRREMDGSETVSATNEVSELIPALGATYQFNDHLQFLAGYHRGFAVTSASETNVDPESSDNYELGARFQWQELQLDMIAFYSDYSNAVQNCSAAYTCDDPNNPGEELDWGSISMGASQVTGLEFLSAYSYGFSNGLSIPMSLSYTYTQSRIDEDSDNAKAGDIMANMPEHMANASIGLAAIRWDSYLNAAYTDEMCSDTSCHRNDGTQATATDDLLTFDWIGNYYISSELRTYMRVENLTNERAVVSYQPDGARANKPRTFYVGFSYNF